MTGNLYPGGAWFRIFGRGLSIEDRRRQPALFSERIGYVRVLRMGPWAIRWLPKVRQVDAELRDLFAHAIVANAPSHQSVNTGNDPTNPSRL